MATNRKGFNMKSSRIVVEQAYIITTSSWFIAVLVISGIIGSLISSVPLWISWALAVAVLFLLMFRKLVSDKKPVIIIKKLPKNIKQQRITHKSLKGAEKDLQEMEYTYDQLRRQLVRFHVCAKYRIHNDIMQHEKNMVFDWEKEEGLF